MSDRHVSDVKVSDDPARDTHGALHGATFVGIAGLESRLYLEGRGGSASGSLPCFNFLSLHVS